MDNLEKAEKIREKTGVSYEDAKKALEACDYDMLDAIVYLETLGKIKGPASVSYTSVNAGEYYDRDMGSAEFIQAQKNYEKSCKGSDLGETIDKIASWVGSVVKKAWDIKFVVSRKDEEIFRIPLLVLIVLMIVTVFTTLVVLVVGLFCDFRYRLDGVDDVSVNINEFCDRAGNAASDIKKDFQKK